MAGVGERQRLAIEAGSPHGNRRRFQALAGQLPADIGRLHRIDLRDSRGVEGHVVPQPEADLQHVAGKTRADAASQGLSGLQPAPEVDHPWKHMLAVQPHRSPPRLQRLRG
jgi:hypothetical protein